MTEQQTPQLPTWTKPLDTVENCAERVDTDDFAFDWDQYLAALTFLTERTQELPFDLEFAVPQGEHFLSRTTDPKWDRVVSLTEDRCGCGQHRHIIGGAKPKGLAGDDKLVTASIGQAIDLLSRGLHRRQTTLRLSVVDIDGKPCLTQTDRPYTATIDFNELFFGKKAYPLERIAAHVLKRGPVGVVQGKDERMICEITADPAAGTITVRPNEGFDVTVVTL